MDPFHDERPRGTEAVRALAVSDMKSWVACSSSIGYGSDCGSSRLDDLSVRGRATCDIDLTGKSLTRASSADAYAAWCVAAAQAGVVRAVVA